MTEEGALYYIPNPTLKMLEYGEFPTAFEARNLNEYMFPVTSKSAATVRVWDKLAPVYVPTYVNTEFRVP